MYRRILVATDGSKLSRKAEQAAIGLAVAMGAELVAFCVAPKLSRSLLNPAVGGARIDPVRVEAYWTEYANETAERLSQKAQKSGVVAKAVTVVSHGIGEAIVKNATKLKCDVIVMASHGRRGVERFLLGSETQHVLVHTDLPVLVIR